MSTVWPRVQRCEDDSAHESHEHSGGVCPGLTALGSLSLSQIEAVADRMGVDPGLLALSLVPSGQ